MTIVITKVHDKYMKHRSLVIGSRVPNIFEFYLLFKRPKAFAYIGKGNEWYHYVKPSPTAQPKLKKLGYFKRLRFLKAYNRFLTFKKVFA